MEGQFVNHGKTVRHFVLEPIDGGEAIEICLGPKRDKEVDVVNTGEEVVYSGDIVDLPLANSSNENITNPPNENLVITNSGDEVVLSDR